MYSADRIPLIRGPLIASFRMGVVLASFGLAACPVSGGRSLVGDNDPEDEGTRDAGPIDATEGGMERITLLGATVDVEPPPQSLLARVERATVGARIRVGVVLSRAVQGLDVDMAARGPEGVTLSFAWVRSEDRTARFVAEVPPDAVSGTYLPTVGIRLEDGSRAELQFTEPPILVDTRGGTLAVNPDRVSFVRSAVGNSRSEILEGEDGRFVLPPTIDRGALAPADPLAPVDHLQADAFSIDGSERPRQIRVWSDVGRSQLLATSEPRADGTWP